MIMKNEQNEQSMEINHPQAETVPPGSKNLSGPQIPGGEKIAYSVQEVASMLGVSTTTIYRAIWHYGLKAYKKFDRWYIFRQDVEAFIRKSS